MPIRSVRARALGMPVLFPGSGIQLSTGCRNKFWVTTSWYVAWTMNSCDPILPGGSGGGGVLLSLAALLNADQAKPTPNASRSRVGIAPVQASPLPREVRAVGTAGLATPDDGHARVAAGG